MVRHVLGINVIAFEPRSYRRKNFDCLVELNIDGCRSIPFYDWLDSIGYAGVKDYSESDDDGVRILVTGKPGCGKSYVISTITELASIMNLRHIATCSYSGIAAVNIDGFTICSLLSINDRTAAGKHCSKHESSHMG